MRLPHFIQEIQHVHDNFIAFLKRIVLKMTRSKNDFKSQKVFFNCPYRNASLPESPEQVT